jgi:mRNA deadenylase 3'-5' endonuclease subunit Ccr4
VTLSESANFLAQVSEERTCARIHEELAGINGRWKRYQDRFKNTVHEAMIKYYECDHSLGLIKERLAKIDNLLNKQVKCKLSAVSKYAEELHRCFSEMDSMNANMSLIVKLTAKIDFDQNVTLKSSFIADIKNTDAKLIQLKYIMPDYIARVSKACAQLKLIDDSDGIAHIEAWAIEAARLLHTEPGHFSSAQVLEHLELIKVCTLQNNHQRFVLFVILFVFFFF